MIIRLATPADPLELLATEGGVTGLNEERTREILGSAINAGECLVHVGPHDEIEGFVITNALAFFGRDFVKLLIVSSHHRRKGVARALLEAAMATGGTEVVFASTNESNAAMRALFEREGWTLSGVLTGIDEEDPEMVFWQRRERTRDSQLPAN